MRLLIIDNSAVVQREGRHYTNTLNGLFLSELRDLGHKISCIQFASERTDSISVFCLENNQIDFVELPSKGNKVMRYLKSIPKLVKAIKDSDFIYLYYPNSLRWVSFICRFLKRPYGLYIRGMNGIWDRVSLRIYQHAFTICTVAESFTNKVNAIVKKRIANTIRPMISYSDADVVFTRLYEQKNKYNVLYLGRIAKDKGLAELIKASLILKGRGLLFDLHLVGNGEFTKELKQTVEENGMSDFVFFDGPIYSDEKKAECYLNSDIYILPTYHEGFPRTLYESMIFGTPVITTFVGGIPALMKDGVNCKRIEPHSVDSIVDSLSFAIENYDIMGRMARNGTEMVSKIVDRNRPTHAYYLDHIINRYGQ